MRTLLLTAFLFLSGAATSRALEPGLELQVYFTGVVLDARLMSPWEENTSWSVYAGYNYVDRGDHGKHDDETGGGPGVGIGARHYEHKDFTGKAYGLRFDLWMLGIDWEEAGVKGSSDTLTFQPTLDIGYAWRVNDALRVEGMVSVGAQWNVSTDGEDVGEGPTGLIGVAALYEF